MTEAERAAFTAMEDALEEALRLIRTTVREYESYPRGMYAAVDRGRRALELAANFPRLEDA